ncbi:hypothetical protein [Parachlamydia acanthamoebae]|uniref:hypothetical protein n=1 Tax=Parachlamydia acanthamoebae TaxID=83552 RepID=UPI000751318A|nr:hypothetical protein [Parachlamydia acanthamoebae]
MFALAPSQSLGGQAWEIPLHPDVMFAYGQQQVLAAMNNPKGQAISYRFKKDAKSWRVFTSTALPKADCISQEGLGVIGIDLNADHIAYMETDRFGKPIKSRILSWVLMEREKNSLKRSQEISARR